MDSGPLVQANHPNFREIQPATTDFGRTVSPRVYPELPVQESALGEYLRVLLKRKWTVAGVSAVIAAWFGWYYAVTDKVPTQFVYITPYAVTLLVLGFASQRLRPPEWDGKPWRKGQAT